MAMAGVRRKMRRMEIVMFVMCVYHPTVPTYLTVEQIQERKPRQKPVMHKVIYSDIQNKTVSFIRRFIFYFINIISLI